MNHYVCFFLTWLLAAIYNGYMMRKKTYSDKLARQNKDAGKDRDLRWGTGLRRLMTLVDATRGAFNRVMTLEACRWRERENGGFESIEHLLYCSGPNPGAHRR